MAPVKIDSRATAARAFVRNLNILLKFARLYGFDHTRTTAQFEIAWDELHSALLVDNEAGLLLAAAGSQLLLDGMPLGSSPAERNFAQLLTSVGLASIHFSPSLTRDDLGCFVRAFPGGSGQPAVLAEQFKAAVEGVSGIRLNEICFVPADSAHANFKMAAQITARALGADAEQARDLFDDPHKLLQLIAAAEGSKGGSGASAGGSTGGGGRGGIGSGSGPTGFWASTKAALLGTPAAGTELFFPEEEDVRGILRLLRQLSKDSRDDKDAPVEPIAFQQRLTSLSMGARFRFREALAALAAQAPAERPQEPLLLRLAEHLAVRFAMECYERGDVRVNAVRQMLDRMGQEVESLRKILAAHENKMAEAGVAVESYTDQLDQHFWAAVPESTKRGVLASPEAWCVPPRNIRRCVEEQLRSGEKETSRNILGNYASCITQQDAEARRKTAAGLCELAEVYGEDGALLVEAIDKVGGQLNAEQDAELRSQVGAAFVRLSQEAATRRCYPAMQQTLTSLEIVEAQRPGFARSLRPRVGLEDRLPELIEDVLRDADIPDGLAELVRRMSRAAAQHLARRFGQVGFREDCNLLVELAREMGPEGVARLRETFSEGAPGDSVETVGLLSCLDAAILEQGLPARMREWPRVFHDRAVRQLAAGGSPERGRLLLSIFEALDPLIRPLALDEIGMSVDPAAVAWLIGLAERESMETGGSFPRLKAIEALGRLRAREAVPLLRGIAETKQVWRWVYPGELRIVAAQALGKIDPDWAQDFLPRSGFEPGELSLEALDRDADSSCIRQRRYRRLRLAKPLTAVTTNLRENCHLEIQALNLGGGVAGADRHFPPGTVLALKINSGLRSMRAQVFVRDAQARTMAFEIADISLEDRARLRRLLADLGSTPPSGSPKNRSRRRRPVLQQKR